MIIELILTEAANWGDLLVEHPSYPAEQGGAPDRFRAEPALALGGLRGAKPRKQAV